MTSSFTESAVEDAALGWAVKRGPNWKTKVKGVKQLRRRGNNERAEDMFQTSRL